MKHLRQGLVSVGKDAQRHDKDDIWRAYCGTLCMGPESVAPAVWEGMSILFTEAEMVTDLLPPKEQFCGPCIQARKAHEVARRLTSQHKDLEIPE